MANRVSHMSLYSNQADLCITGKLAAEFAQKHLGDNYPPRQNSCRPDMILNLGAIRMKDGTVRRSIQEQDGGAVVAAGERECGRGGERDWSVGQTLERGRAWTAGARLEAVITAAALDEAGKSAWCREHAVYPAELDKWRSSATTALAEPEEARASPQATRQDKKRIKELERDLLRKDRALAETAALLVLSKKVAAIFNKGEGE